MRNQRYGTGQSVGIGDPVTAAQIAALDKEYGQMMQEQAQTDQDEFERANNNLATMMGRPLPHPQARGKAPQPLTSGAASTRGKAGKSTKVDTQSLEQKPPARNTLQYDPKAIAQLGDMARMMQHLQQNPKDTQASKKLARLVAQNGLSSFTDVADSYIDPNDGTFKFLDSQGKEITKNGISMDDFSRMVQSATNFGNAAPGDSTKYSPAVQQVANPDYEKYQQEQNGFLYDKDAMGMANTLRGNFRTDTKDFNTLEKSFKKMATAKETGAGDVSLIFNYMKMLDEPLSRRKAVRHSNWV